VRDGAVTAEQLEQALVKQRERPDQRLGDILLAEGFVTPLAISCVLAEQHELEFVDLDLPSIDTSAALLLAESLTCRYRALPIRILDDDSVLVAVADPTNVISSDELHVAVGMAVSQGMATLREDGVRLAAAGITTLDEVSRVAGETVGLTS
jgi:type IV pilus assembly protein PilB